MKRPFSSRSLPETVRRRIDMAVAVGEERLLSTQVTYALDFIALVDDELPFDDALDVYARLLRLSGEEASVLSTRVLATLGERAEQTESWPDVVEGNVTDERDEEPRRRDARSFLAQLRERLRGRINDRLRSLIELEAARAEEALLYTHVENALNFIDLLEEEMAPPEALDLYLDALDVRDAISEVVYHLALSRLARKRLPETHRRRRLQSDEAGAERDRNGRSDRPLKVVDSDGG